VPSRCLCYVGTSFKQDGSPTVYPSIAEKVVVDTAEESEKATPGSLGKVGVGVQNCPARTLLGKKNKKLQDREVGSAAF